MKAYKRVEELLHSFSTSALDSARWSASQPGCFSPSESTYPLNRRLGGPQSLPGFKTRLPQPKQKKTQWSLKMHLYFRIQLCGSVSHSFPHLLGPQS